jgi:hypothetical protein
MNTLTSKLRRGLVNTLIAGMVLAPLPACVQPPDAPLIILDPAATTTDVYVCR